jgi:hypothetical protein
VRLRVVVLIGLCGCGDSHAKPVDAGADALPDAAPDADMPPADPNNCVVLFRPDQVSDFYITITPENLAAIESDFRSPYVTYQQTGVWPQLPKNYYPLVEFKWANQTTFPPVTDAQIRLKGASSWRHTIELDGDKAKMQFVISFNETNPNGRFVHQRKLELDMPRNDASMLRSRVGLSYLRRDLGVPAQCANNARLFINGTYYGAYTAQERLDKEFLQRNFPGGTDDDGDLWEQGDDLVTNELTANPARRNALFAATSMTEVTPLADMDYSVLEWAGESMMPDGDGYYGSGHNFYLYDHPTRGFMWLPHDLDSSMTYRPYNISPLYWARDEQPRPHYLLVMHDATWRAKWAAALCGPAYQAYDVAALQARIDEWGAQVMKAAETDPHYLFTPAQQQAAITAMHDEVAARKQFMASWCDCFNNGGTDSDSDGTPWCLDSDDADPNVKIGAAEVCGPDPVELEPLDDNCDGYIDEGCP